MFPDGVGGDVSGVDDNISGLRVWQVTFVISGSDVMTPPNCLIFSKQLQLHWQTQKYFKLFF